MNKTDDLKSLVGPRPDPDHAGLSGVGSGPVGESGLGAVTHSLGAGWGDALPAVRGEHHASPLETSGDGVRLGRGIRPVGR